MEKDVIMLDYMPVEIERWECFLAGWTS
jgi:hypothetical protein